MKNIIFLVSTFSVLLFSVSCNDRLEGDEIVNTASLKIDSVKVERDTMFLSSTQIIKTYSNYTSKCEGFYGYDYLYINEFDRKVISYKFKTDAACGESVIRSSQINFKPVKMGTYNFKFYNGKSASGEDIFLEREIVVN